MGTPLLKPKRKLTSLELSAPARGALRRLKARHGMSYTHAVERGALALEVQLLPEPPPADTVATLYGRSGPAKTKQKSEIAALPIIGADPTANRWRKEVAK